MSLTLFKLSVTCTINALLHHTLEQLWSFLSISFLFLIQPPAFYISYLLLYYNLRSPLQGGQPARSQGSLHIASHVTFAATDLLHSPTTAPTHALWEAPRILSPSSPSSTLLPAHPVRGFMLILTDDSQIHIPTQFCRVSSCCLVLPTHALPNVLH